MSKLKIVIDTEKCIGCGSCAIIAPEVFEIGDDGKSKIKEGMDVIEDDSLKEQVIEAKEACPTGAIIVEEVE